jgi:hypothetical protein
LQAGNLGQDVIGTSAADRLCSIGISQRHDDRRLQHACIDSYGQAVLLQGEVLSVCAILSEDYAAKSVANRLEDHVCRPWYCGIQIFQDQQGVFEGRKMGIAYRI